MNSRRKLLACYGYGAPDLGRAIWSLRNDVTLVVEDHLRPFRKRAGRIGSGEMNLHRIPWPTEVLASLGDASVEMRVTLSYFIEPNPARRGWTPRHAHRSHGLRFAVKRATESSDQFRERINKEARDLDGALTPRQSAPTDSGWRLGPCGQDRGSIHGDIWKGSAADLASRGEIAVYPVGGWWRERPALERWKRPARYALIVSITTPSTEVDLYASIKALVPTPIAIAVAP